MVGIQAEALADGEEPELALVAHPGTAWARAARGSSGGSPVRWTPCRWKTSMRSRRAGGDSSSTDSPRAAAQRRPLGVAAHHQRLGRDDHLGVAAEGGADDLLVCGRRVRSRRSRPRGPPRGTSRTDSSNEAPARRPSRLWPPQPRPAALTSRPVRPSTTLGRSMSIDGPHLGRSRTDGARHCQRLGLPRAPAGTRPTRRPRPCDPRGDVVGGPRHREQAQAWQAGSMSGSGWGVPSPSTASIRPPGWCWPPGRSPRWPW